jgi:hypothetical protein
MPKIDINNTHHNFKILITDHKKQFKAANFEKKNGVRDFKSIKINHLPNAIGYYKKFIELSSEVFFPQMWTWKEEKKGSDIVVRKNNEILLCVKKDYIKNKVIPKWMLDKSRDFLGREVELQASHPGWVILFSSPYQVEEKFTVHRQDNPKKWERIKFLEIYENFIVNNDIAKFISYYGNYVYIMDNFERLTMIRTKCLSDTERFVSVLKKKLFDDESTIPIVFLDKMLKQNLRILHEHFIHPIFGKHLINLQILTKEYDNPKDVEEYFIRLRDRKD